MSTNLLVIPATQKLFAQIMNEISDKNIAENGQISGHWGEIFIQRPVIAISFCLLILLSGLKALADISVSQFPRLASAMLEINTSFVGASAEAVKSFVTDPMERVLSAVPGVDYLDSTTTAGLSNIRLWLHLNEDIPSAISEASTQLDRIKYELPSGAYDPSIEVVRADRPWAGFYLPVVLKNGISRSATTDFLEREILPSFGSIAGVRKAEIIGGRSPAMRIWLNPELMTALDIRTSDIRSAISNNSVIATLGKTENSVQRIDMLAKPALLAEEDFENLILRESNDEVIRLGDVALVKIDEEGGTENSRYTQDDAVFIAVWPMPGANEIDIADILYTEIDSANDRLPGDLEIQLGYDCTKYMRSALKEIVITLLETIILVGLVVTIFMGSVRNALVPLITIPVSLLGAVAAIYAMGFSLNLLTILAIVLAVGLVVDDAIVVVENVARLIRSGVNPNLAAMQSSRQLFSPIFSMTLTLAIVYLPIGFLSGLTGALFKEFAFTLAIAVIISGIIAVTLSPVMSATVCRNQILPGKTEKLADGIFDRVRAGYASLLKKSLNSSGSVLIVYLFSILLIPLLYVFSKQELAPIEDTGSLMMIIKAPPDASLEFNTSSMSGVVSALEDLPGREQMWQRLHEAGGFAGQTFSDHDERDVSVQELLPLAFNNLSRVPELKALPTLETSLPTAGNFDVEFVVQSSESLDEMYPYVQQMLSAAASSGLYLYTDTDLVIDLPQVNIKIDYELAADLGFSHGEVMSQLGFFYAEEFIEQFNINDRAYKIIPMAAEDFRDNPSKLLDLMVTNAAGLSVPLSSLAVIERVAAPRSLGRFEQKNAFRIFGALIPGRTKEEGLEFLERTAEEVLPANYSYDYAGESRQIRKEGSSLFSALAIALVIVYFVLAVQFNCFRNPLIILMGSVPLGFMSALLFTYLDFTTINIYSQIGFITLAGLVSKNAILIVQFANSLYKTGMSRYDAIFQGAAVRLRPVLMTSGATILGHFPLVLVTGAGAEARNSIGIILVAGMLVGTLFTIFILPSLYLWFSSSSREKDAREVKVSVEV